MEKEAEHRMAGNVNQGANVRKLRQILGIKQEALAEMLGVAQPVVSRLEGRQVIEENTLMKIANALNISPRIIQGLEENPLSVIIENNTFEQGSYNETQAGTIDYDNENHHNNNNPLEKVVELSKETGSLYERILALEKEKSALLEQLLKEKQG